jgi:hypothetical protein
MSSIRSLVSILVLGSLVSCAHWEPMAAPVATRSRLPDEVRIEVANRSAVYMRAPRFARDTIFGRATLGSDTRTGIALVDVQSLARRQLDRGRTMLFVAWLAAAGGIMWLELSGPPATCEWIC